MKKVIAEKIERLNTLLENKVNQLQGNEKFSNSPFTQGNIDNLREDLHQKKLLLEDASTDPLQQKNIFTNFNDELNSIEQKISDLKVVEH